MVDSTGVPPAGPRTYTEDQLSFHTHGKGKSLYTIITHRRHRRVFVHSCICECDVELVTETLEVRLCDEYVRVSPDDNVRF